MGCASSSNAGVDAPAATRTADAPPPASAPSSEPGRDSPEVAVAANDFILKYRAGARLGKGAFGVVSRVTRLADGAEFADKVVVKRGHWQRQLAEVEVWKRVSEPAHPGILTLLDFVETADALHLVTEVMAGGELFEQLEANDAFSEAACRQVGVQLVAAVAYLHLTHKTAHLDLKPANVLCRDAAITTPGCIKLADFGFAKPFKDARAPEFAQQCGTLEYYAPELVANHESRNAYSGATPFGAGVDCWALGCVLYELLFGEPPFWSKDEAAQLALIKAHELKFPPEVFDKVSAGAKGLIRLLLDADAAARPTVDEALRHPWLQGTEDAELRELLDASLPAAATRNRRRTSEVRKEARANLRSAITKVAAISAFSGGSASYSNSPSRRASRDETAAAAPVDPAADPDAPFDPRFL